MKYVKTILFYAQNWSDEQGASYGRFSGFLGPLGCSEKKFRGFVGAFRSGFRRDKDVVLLIKYRAVH